MSDLAVEPPPRAKPTLWARYSSTSPIVVAALAIVLGLVFGAIVIATTTPVVLDAWRAIFHSWDGIPHALNVTFNNVGAAYRSIFTGSIVDPQGFWHSLTTGKGWPNTLTPISETFTYATPLVIISIGVGIAFQAGLFNIGANGQAVIGGIGGAVVGSMINMPTVIHVPLSLLGGIVGGMICGAVPGFLKAFTGAHEVIVTLMFNYVTYAFLLFAVLSTPFQQPGQQNDIGRTLYPSAILAPLFGTKSGLRVSYGIFVAIAVVIFAWWLLDRSSLGFDFRVTGANPAAAHASGISARFVIVTVFLISGGLAGLAGFVQVASTTHYIDGGFLIGNAGIGFTAITVALLGRNRPIGIVWASLLFAALSVGGRNMQASTGIPLDLATVIQSAIVLFVATPVLVKEIFRLRAAPTATLQPGHDGLGLVSLTTISPTSATPAAKNRRTRVIAVIMVALGVFTLFVFGFGTDLKGNSQLTFTPLNTTNAPWHLGTLTVPTHWTNVVVAIIMIALGAEVFVREPRRFVMGRFGIVALLFLFSLLVWASRSTGPAPINFINVTSILVGASATTMVLIFGSLSGIMCERAGVVNIAIEGQFIGGAFLGSMVASTTGNFFYAAIAGIAIGALIGLVLAFFSLRYHADQIIVGIVLVTMLSSLSSYLNLQVLTPFPNFNLGNTAPNLAIPVLSKIPIIGPVFFNQSGFWYAMLVILGVVSFALFKTRYGLHVRAVGEHPKAAATVGIRVVGLRYTNVVLGGAIAGLGGVAFMATQGQFQVGYTSGLGYIALAAMIFGRWRPSGAVVASVIFGLSVYLSYNLVTYQVPISIYILQMFPYLITIAVVAGLIGRVRPPAADGQPYIPG